MSDLKERLEAEAVFGFVKDGETVAVLREALARIVELEAGLKPFADLVSGNTENGDRIWPGDPDHWTANQHNWGRRVTVGMVRQAAALLHPTDGTDGNV
jgi:hypothetical protein